MSVIDTFGTAWLMLFLKLLAAAPKDAACVYLSSIYLSESAIHILPLFTWHGTTWGCMLGYMMSSFAGETAVSDECADVNCSQSEHRQQN